MKQLLCLMLVQFLNQSVFASDLQKPAEASKTDAAAATDKMTERTSYGAPVDKTKSVIGVEEAITRFADLKNKTILLDAQIDKVCLKKGCWMTIKGQGRDIRVVFKDYSFFVPQKIMGKKVLVEGELIEKKLSLSETKHYVADAGGDPSKVTEPATDYQFVASGVELK